jgi:hypothetical protein
MVAGKLVKHFVLLTPLVFGLTKTGDNRAKSEQGHG